MKHRQATRRYTARPELKATIVRQGRMAMWFAEQLGVSQGFFSHVMAGRKSIAESDARLIAAVLGTELSSLFDVSDGTKNVPDGEAA